MIESARTVAEVPQCGQAASLSLEFTAGLREVAGEVVHASGWLSAQAQIQGPWDASADARAAWYEADRWTSNGTQWSGYIEAMYRRSGVQLSAGFGIDPLVFIRVSAEYADIGYTEYLRRGALADGVNRARADEIVRALIASEESLKDAAVFKIELVVDLR